MAVRGLTVEEAEKGVGPVTLTRAEWHAMHVGSLQAEHDARERHRRATWDAVAGADREVP